MVAGVRKTILWNLLACDGQESTKEPFAFAVFERVFKEFGLPSAIRIDNGLPFSSPNALYGPEKIIGITQTDEHIWLVIFMNYDLGYFDECPTSVPGKVSRFFARI